MFMKGLGKHKKLRIVTYDVPVVCLATIATLIICKV